jgi:hypothetical protein
VTLPKSEKPPPLQISAVYAKPNPFRSVTGYAFINLNGMVPGGARNAKYLYPTTGQLFVHNPAGQRLEIDKIVDSGIYVNSPIYNSQDMPPAYGAGTSTGAMTFLDFQPFDHPKLVFPTLSTLDSLMPIWMIFPKGTHEYSYGAYDPTTKGWTPIPGLAAGPEIGIWPLDYLGQNYGRLEDTLALPPLVKYTVARASSPLGTILPYRQQFNDIALTGLIGVLDQCYLHNWSFELAGPPENVTYPLSISQPVDLTPWGLQWVKSGQLPVDHIDDINALNQRLPFTINGHSCTLKVAAGPYSDSGYGTWHWILVDEQGTQTYPEPSVQPDAAALATLNDPIASANLARQHLYNAIVGVYGDKLAKHQVAELYP